MNSDFDYFDVSQNIEILHLNDSNEFENEINKQLEKKTEPVDRGVQGSREAIVTDRSRETTPHLKPTAGAEASKQRPVVFLTSVR